ncbi:hypothetical protein Pla8534_70490 [Lignipirellula cremea]|uniref:Integrase catalytic domain-containing protein n=2 Tax=Lignipirellula cremea TaxID=2528010 RepID=A0A518E4Z1_9BACT|nr:hypothetical protein Pla8534_70490 [Lignipirellula cremea]
MDPWAYSRQVTLDFSRPGKPTDNAFIESFDGSVRAECLNEKGVLSLALAQEMIKSWCCDGNAQRPHSALGNLAPRAKPAFFSPSLAQKRGAGKSQPLLSSMLMLKKEAFDYFGEFAERDSFHSCMPSKKMHSMLNQPPPSPRRQ